MSALITRRTARSWCAPSACRVTSSTSSAPATRALLQATSAGMLVEVLQPPGAAGAGAAGAAREQEVRAVDRELLAKLAYGREGNAKLSPHVPCS